MEKIDYEKLPRRDILCVDVKSFFASVEAVRRKIHPLEAYIIVISNFDRPGAVVLASSPRVKSEYGIKTGNRKYEIPDDKQLMVVEPSMELYLKVNKMICDIFRRYVSEEDLLIYSIDESLLDVTNSKALFGDAMKIAEDIQKTIWRELKLVVSVGIGDNPLLAKLALDNDAKHNKRQIAYWGYEHVQDKLWNIEKLTDMWGVSNGYKKKLNRLGIFSVYDLAHSSPAVLKEHFGIMGLQLYYHSHGVDYSRLSEREAPKSKSYGKGQTLMRDYEDKNEILLIISELVEDVSSRLRANGKTCNCISLGIRVSNKSKGQGFHKDLHLSRSTHNTQELIRYFFYLFEKNWDCAPVRQLYVSLSGLADDDYEQLNVFTFIKDEKQNKLDTIMDDLRDRFGKTSVFKASNLSEGSNFMERSQYVGGHKGRSDVNDD